LDLEKELESAKAGIQALKEEILEADPEDCEALYEDLFRTIEYAADIKAELKLKEELQKKEIAAGRRESTMARIPVQPAEGGPVASTLPAYDRGIW